jgi:uncharacterized protein (DUF849 family)
MGGNVRVGLEDSVLPREGAPGREQRPAGRKIARILGELSLDIATPADAREMLGLKGRRTPRWARGGAAA